MIILSDPQASKALLIQPLVEWDELELFSLILRLEPELLTSLSLSN